ncbi:MAG: ATP synthase A1 subunit C [Methermicoccaceae archaeon]
MTGRVLTYAYSNARIRAMKPDLLTEDVLLNLIHVKSTHEMITFLDGTVYKPYLAELSVERSGVDLIELALSRQFAATARKVRSFTPRVSKKTVNALLEKWDVQNLRTVLQAKRVGKDFKDIETYLVFAGTLSKDDVKKLMDTKDVEGVVLALVGTKYHPILAAHLDAYKKSGDLIPMINALYKAYYDGLSKSVEGRLGDEMFVKVQVRSEIDAKNVMTVLRFIHEGVSDVEIPKVLIGGGNIPEKELNEIARSKTVEDVVNRVKKYFDLSPVMDDYEKEGSIVPFEDLLYRLVVERGLSRLSLGSLSVSVIVHYLYRKESEVANIRKIAKAKQLGISPEKTEQYIVGMGRHSILGKKIEV